MKLGTVLLLIPLLVFLAIQIRDFSFRDDAARKEYERLQGEVNRARRDAEALQGDFTYFSNPLNLEKELRARFNYRSPGEKLIIIVPSPTTSTP